MGCRWDPVPLCRRHWGVRGGVATAARFRGRNGVWGPTSPAPCQPWQRCSSPGCRPGLFPSRNLFEICFVCKNTVVLLELVSVDQGGSLCVCAIPSGYHTPKLTRLRGTGERGMMDCAPESSLMVWFCQESGQKSNPLVLSGGAGIDFVSLRAELLRTKEHFIYFPQKSIIYSFYFSDYENSPFSQVCIRSAWP